MKSGSNLLVASLPLALCLSICQASAQDLRISIQFSLTTTDPLAPGLPISATIVYHAPSLLDPVQSFESINMTIAGHSYSVDEIGYRYLADNMFEIYGLTNGPP